jgi:hypothetical protein
VPRIENKWDQRIERACELAGACPFAAQILGFYATITEFHKNCYLRFAFACRSGTGRAACLPATLGAVDLELLMAHFGAFLAMIEEGAPATLAEFAGRLAAQGPSVWPVLLRESWRAGRQIDEIGGASPAASGEPELDAFADFCGHTFLQPYAELLSDRANLRERPVRRPVCPCCGSRPLAGVLRPEGNGARQSLVCSFCRREWDYLRIACPACEERDEKKLCVYTTERFPHVRVEACNTCRTYCKTVDLTRDGRAVPEVDELASIPLSLWAGEKGYRKISRNLAGL